MFILLNAVFLLAEENQANVEDPSATLPEMLVEGQRPILAGTGSLNLKQPSQGSSRLGLTLREIPASINGITDRYDGFTFFMLWVEFSIPECVT